MTLSNWSIALGVGSCAHGVCNIYISINVKRLAVRNVHCMNVLCIALRIRSMYNIYEEKTGS